MALAQWLLERLCRHGKDILEKKLEMLNGIVFCIAFLEWAGNALGTIAFLWATVVLLGGFCSLLNHKDFWFSTIMVFLEGSRVFIRNDTTVNQWLFGSTRAFRFENFFSGPRVKNQQVAATVVLLSGLGFSFTPMEFHPQIAAGILKLALVAITSQLLAHLDVDGPGGTMLFLFMAAGILGGTAGLLKMLIHSAIIRFKALFGGHLKHCLHLLIHDLKLFGIFVGWVLGVCFLLVITFLIMALIVDNKPVVRLCVMVTIASGLAMFPFLQTVLGAYYRYLSISISCDVLLLLVLIHCDEEDDTSCCRFLQILEMILPILYFWCMMSPFPGISLKLSLYILLAVILGMVIRNLQIPVALLQVLLAGLRLGTLVSHQPHDYLALPPDASPNLVPSIVLFYLMELFQGSCYILATIFGFLSVFLRHSLLRQLKLSNKRWGNKALTEYQHEAYQARTEKGLLPSEKSKSKLSLQSWAINSLGSDTSEMQILGVLVLRHFLAEDLEQQEPNAKEKLIRKITSASKKVVPTTIDMLGYQVSEDEEIAHLTTTEDIKASAAKIMDELSGGLRISEFPGMLRQISSLLDAENLRDAMKGHTFLLGLSILRKLDLDSHNWIEIDKDAKDIIKKIIEAIKFLNDHVYPEALRSAQQEALNSAHPEALRSAQREALDSAHPEALRSAQREALDSAHPEALRSAQREALDSAHPEALGYYILGSTQQVAYPGTLHYVLHFARRKADPAYLEASAQREALQSAEALRVVQREALDSALEFISRLAIKGGEIGARFRQKLSKNPDLLHILERVLDVAQEGQRKLVMDIIAKLALDEAIREEIGSTESIINKLTCAFLTENGHSACSFSHNRTVFSTTEQYFSHTEIQSVQPQNSVFSLNEQADCSMQQAAGEALVNLTIMSRSNCQSVLLADSEDRLIEQLISRREEEDYIYVASNLLYNLCAYSKDKLISHVANKNHLERALPKVMETIRTTEDKQLEAALCIASQIGYNEYFAQMLESDTSEAEQLVDKLVFTLKSKRPCIEYPRIRRVLLEVVISIVELCPRYSKVFKEKGMIGALRMVRATPSRLEKYRIFLDGEGVVDVENLPMHDLVDKAERLIYL